MISHAENELLCRVGPATQMGDLMRRYWVPAVYPPDLPSPDCAPIRVRLFGENLVAFRDSAGKPGLIKESCPHRGASLFFGRNEEAGLRCVYHGWKFDTAGNCVDMPNEPAESDFKAKVKATTYPCIERSGIIWAYLGPPSEQPKELPGFMSNLLPDDHVFVTVRVQQSNYLQALEGGYDSTHVGFLHSRLDAPADARDSRQLMMQDKRPRFAAVQTDFGVMIGARRETGSDQAYWRVNLFLMPFYHMSPGTPVGLQRWNAWVPIDDETTLRWVVAWQADRPISEADLAPLRHGDSPAWGLLTADDYAPSNTLPGGRWRTKANLANDYFIDRTVQRTKTFTGISGFLTQDQAVTESMGPLVDRQHERLGSADLGIIAARRRLSQAARALRSDGTPPVGVLTPEAYTVNSGSVMLPRDADWVAGVQDVVVLRAQSSQS
jgi:phthalate 4,5-dioxygenase